MHKKQTILLIIFISILFAAIGCTKEAPSNQAKPSEQVGVPSDQEKNNSSNTPSKNTEKEIQTLIDSMSLEEKLGQLFFVGISGTTLSDTTKELIHKYKVGGIILFAANLETPDQSVELINKIKLENSINPLPLLFGVDQEGGRVTRLPEITKTPAAGQIGNTNDAELTYQIGALLGKQLNAFGFNVNFAPVLDVNSNPENPVIGDRALSSDPSIVSNLGIAMMKGMQSEHIIPVVKHFPGHGDTSVDSHLELPIVNKSLDDLNHLELIPFREAINSNAHAVMIAHILLPKIDPNFPASMSKKVITDILRTDLEFQGVVITDDLTMQAIANHYDLGGTAVESIIAGSDIIMVAHEYKNVVTTMNALKTAVENGVLSEERINESVRRIISLKIKYDLTNDPIEEIKVEELNYLTDEVLNKIK